MLTPKELLAARGIALGGALLNHKATLAQVRALGMSILCDQGEYRVSYRAADMPSGERREACAYYSTNREDVVLTAAAMRSALDLGHVR